MPNVILLSILIDVSLVMFISVFPCYIYTLKIVSGNCEKIFDHMQKIDDTKRRHYFLFINYKGNMIYKSKSILRNSIQI